MRRSRRYFTGGYVLNYFLTFWSLCCFSWQPLVPDLPRSLIGSVIKIGPVLSKPIRGSKLPRVPTSKEKCKKHHQVGQKLPPLLMIVSLVNDNTSNVTQWQGQWFIDASNLWITTITRCCTRWCFTVSMTTSSPARRVLLNRDCNMMSLFLILTLWSYYLHIISLCLSVSTTPLNHLSNLSSLSVPLYIVHEQIKSWHKDRRCVWLRERETCNYWWSSICEPSSPQKTFVISDAGRQECVIIATAP